MNTSDYLRHYFGHNFVDKTEIIPPVTQSEASHSRLDKTKVVAQREKAMFGTDKRRIKDEKRYRSFSNYKRDIQNCTSCNKLLSTEERRQLIIINILSKYTKPFLVTSHRTTLQELRSHTLTYTIENYF